MNTKDAAVALLYSRIVVPDHVIVDDAVVDFYYIRIAADLVELGASPTKAKDLARELAYDLADIYTNQWARYFERDWLARAARPRSCGPGWGVAVSDSF